MVSKPEAKKPRLIMLSGRFYTIDRQLQRFQQVLNPSDYIRFDSTEGKKLCAEFGVNSTCEEGEEAVVV